MSTTIAKSELMKEADNLGMFTNSAESFILFSEIWFPANKNIIELIEAIRFKVNQRMEGAR